MKTTIYELWKDIKGFSNYQISSLGKIRSKPRKRTKGGLLKQTLTYNGYLTTDLFKNGKSKRFYVHRLVAQNFINNKKSKQQINHKNGIKTDNRVENLEWVTGSENVLHSNYTLKNGRAREVYQFDKNGNFIRMYNSIAEVIKINGYNNSSISQCCNGKLKQAYGYIWSYTPPKEDKKIIKIKEENGWCGKQSTGNEIILKMKVNELIDEVNSLKEK